MQKTPADPLYELFEQSLLDHAVLFECEDQFVAHIVEQYVLSLGQMGSLPMQYLDSIREDIADEVYEMLLKKTYGHFNLKAYFSSKLKI